MLGAVVYGTSPPGCFLLELGLEPDTSLVPRSPVGARQPDNDLVHLHGRWLGIRRQLPFPLAGEAGATS